MDRTAQRLMAAAAVLASLVFAGIAFARTFGAATGTREAPAGAYWSPGQLTASQRAADLRFAPGFPAADRAWVLGALRRARPEARELIDALDGFVTVEEHSGGFPAWTQGTSGGFVVSFDPVQVDARGAALRDRIVLHELGHVVDFGLVPDDLAAKLDAEIPRAGACVALDGPYGSCAPRPERFAETFAKWALFGRGANLDSGYQVEMPRSLEDWGAPLGALAAQLAAGA
jgi:hypothetical protein